MPEVAITAKAAEVKAAAPPPNAEAAAAAAKAASEANADAWFAGRNIVDDPAYEGPAPAPRWHQDRYGPGSGNTGNEASGLQREAKSVHQGLRKGRLDGWAHDSDMVFFPNKRTGPDERPELASVTIAAVRWQRLVEALQPDAAGGAATPIVFPADKAPTVGNHLAALRAAVGDDGTVEAAVECVTHQGKAVASHSSPHVLADAGWRLVGVIEDARGPRLHSLVGGAPGAAGALLDRLLRFSGQPATELPHALVFATSRGDVRWVERALYCDRAGDVGFRADCVPFESGRRGKQEMGAAERKWRSECSCGDRGMCAACNEVRYGSGSAAGSPAPAPPAE